MLTRRLQMNVLIACDKFKGSLTSFQVNEIIRQSLRKHFPHSHLTMLVASDGGEGFLDAIGPLLPSSGFEVVEMIADAQDPLNRPMEGRYLHVPRSVRSYIELAEASGLGRLSPDEYNPAVTSTLGTGMLIRDAIEHGAKTVVVGIGGSATNDGGAGIAAALGYGFFDGEGQPFVPAGVTLASVAHVRPPSDPVWREKLKSTRFVTVNDVENPLSGKTGAAQVYAAQKGADSDLIQRLDQAIQHFGAVVIRDLKLSPTLVDEPGTGAAGGVGFGMKAFFEAEFIAASELMLSQLTDSEAFEFVFTGEGKLDDQSKFGKWVCQLARHYRDSSTKIIAACGISELNEADRRILGLDHVIQLHEPGTRSVSESISDAADLLATKIDCWCQQQIGKPTARE